MAVNCKQKATALFPAAVERCAVEHRLTERLWKAKEYIAAGSVTPAVNLDRFHQELSGFDFRSPRQLDEVLGWVIAQLECGIVQITHPRYFGLFNPNPAFAAQCADRIAGAFNPQLASSKTSPVAVEIEAYVTRALANRVGFATGSGGHFTSGGTEANFTALVCALTKADDRFAFEGARVFAGMPTFYVSRESHLAWIKIAHETGIGRSAVRLADTDGCGRMDIAALRKAIAGDKAEGRFPVLLVATAGTTGAGMIDPLVECAAIARENGVWYHVDAAWGGALIVSDRLRGVLSGLELADSATIDAHKWLATTMGCGIFLTPHTNVLSEAFDVSTSYMPSYIPQHDPYLTTAQWSRRFLGLRLFLNLAVAGWEGYADHIEGAIELAAYARASLQGMGWKVINDSPLAVLSLYPPDHGADPEIIVNRVLASGKAWVSVASYEGQKVIRVCVTNGETSKEDVDALVQSLQTAFIEAGAA